MTSGDPSGGMECFGDLDPRILLFGVYSFVWNGRMAFFSSYQRSRGFRSDVTLSFPNIPNLSSNTPFPSSYLTNCVLFNAVVS